MELIDWFVLSANFIMEQQSKDNTCIKENKY
jgi:hypothetical protein